MESKTTPESSLTEIETFTEGLARFCVLAKAEGHTFLPFAGSEPRHFLALPPAMRQKLLERWLICVGAAEDVVAASGAASDDRVFLWSICKRMHLRPVSDVLAYVENGDVIEIYDLDHLQIFRNFAFFSLSSYTIEDLLCRPIEHLIARPEDLQGRVFDVALGILSGKLRGTQHLDFGVHAIDEIDSTRRNRSMVEHKLFSPLFGKDGAVAALMSTTRVHSIQPQAAGCRPGQPSS